MPQLLFAEQRIVVGVLCNQPVAVDSEEREWTLRCAVAARVRATRLEHRLGLHRERIEALYVENLLRSVRFRASEREEQHGNQAASHGPLSSSDVPRYVAPSSIQRTNVRSSSSVIRSVALPVAGWVTPVAGRSLS